MLRIHRSFSLICLLSALVGCSANHQATTSVATSAQRHPTTSPLTYREADDIKTTLTYIASDELEGRGLQTEGINKAADYIAAHFKAAGLQTLPGLNGYFQEFLINVSTTVSKNCRLTLSGKALQPETDFTPLSLSAEKNFSGEVVFVGYSITDPEDHYDDYAGIDVKGKIALAIRYEPTDDKNKSKLGTGEGYSDHATFAHKAKTAADHGAVALLVVDPTSQGRERLMPLNSTGGEKATIPVIQITTAVANDLLKPAAANNLAAIQAEINKNLKPQSALLPNVQIDGNIEINREQKTFKNVVAMLPGKGPRQDEYVVVGAHYDHLGRGEPGTLARNSKQIHNGADDNGSGTVTVMELAQELAKAGPLDRSIIFITFVGEERGLLGSVNFVAHPPVPLEKIEAMFNLDMVGRVRDNVIYVGGNGTAKDWDQVVAKADEDSPLIVKSAGADVGGKGGGGPSDHASFAMKRIPVLFVWSGMHPDYHRPTDKVEKINFTGIAEVVDFGKSVIQQLASMPREQYVDAYDHQRSGGPGGNNVRLGIMPDYNTDSSLSGVRVAGVSSDSPASKAGIQEGDVIVTIDKDKVDSLGDYMDAMAKHKPGETIKVTVDRNKQHVELNAALTAPPG